MTRQQGLVLLPVTWLATATLVLAGCGAAGRDGAAGMPRIQCRPIRMVEESALDVMHRYGVATW